MNLFQMLSKERFCFWGLLLIAAILCVTPAIGQSFSSNADDGNYNFSVYISYGGNTVSAFASSPIPDDLENYALYQPEGDPTWTLSGGNYFASGEGSSFSSGPVSTGNTYTATFNFFMEDFYYSYYHPEDPTECGDYMYGNGDYCEGTDEPSGSASIYVPAPPPIPADPCAVSSNQAAGFTSIVPSGLNLGISGNFSVSFGGSDFAAINPIPTVAYGPYSTPASIAASMAALITRNYARYGLTAKAFGPNVIYSGSMATASGTGTIGLVTNIFSGNGGVSSSFIGNPSPTAPAEATMACEDAPPTPPSSICEDAYTSSTPRPAINVPATITRARTLLSPQCQNRLAVLPGYTTTKLFSTLNKAIFCQYPNTRPPDEPAGWIADTHIDTNTIALLPNFYPPSLDANGQAITLIHEGIHLLGRGTLPDSTVQRDLGLPQDPKNTHNISDYIAGGCYP